MGPTQLVIDKSWNGEPLGEAEHSFVNLHVQRETLVEALGDYVIEGVVTNMPLVSRVLANRRFARATYATGLLDEMLEHPAGATGKEVIAAIALAMAMSQEEAASAMPSRWKMHGRRAAMVNRLM